MTFSITEYFGDLSLLPHALLFLHLLGSVLPTKYQKQAQISFHAIYAAFLLISPNCLYGPKTGKDLDAVHAFLARFIGAYQFGFFVFHFLSRRDSFRPEAAVALSKALTAGLVFFLELRSAQRPNVERGLHLDSSSFVYALILIDFTYFLIESVKYVKLVNQTSATDEIDIMCKKTQQAIQNAGAFSIQHYFWADAVVSFLYAVASIGSSEYLYENVIKQEIKLDSLHRILTHEFGYYALGAGITSLLAFQFSPVQQKHYAFQRLVTHAITIAIHASGYFHFYYHAVFSPLIIALLTVYPIVIVTDKIKRQEVAADDDKNASSSVFATAPETEINLDLNQEIVEQELDEQIHEIVGENDVTEEKVEKVELTVQEPAKSKKGLFKIKKSKK
uniref:Transmembrane protein n=1 Tax=Bursaphelenchus xylophilus TaxID=6326 RepID=A0A1I7SL90_BURXY